MGNDYKIRLITEADKTGLKEVGNELKNTTDQTKKLDDAQKKAGESTKGFAKEHKGLIEGFKKLGQEVPILGAALNALKNPYTAIAFAAGIAVVKVREFQQAVEESATKAQGLDRFNSLVRVFNTLAADQRAKRTGLAEKLDEIATKAKSAEERLSEVNAQIERTLRLEGNEDTANKANELAKIDAQVQAGTLDEAGGIRAKAGVEAKYAARAADRETRRAAGLVTATGNAKRAAEERALALRGQLPGLESAESAAAAKLAQAQAQEENLAAGGVFVNGKAIPLAEALRQRNELVQTGPLKDVGAFAGLGLNLAENDRLKKIADLESGIGNFRNTLDLQKSVTRSAQSDFDIASGRTAAARQGIESSAASAAALGQQFVTQAAGANQEIASGRRVAATDASTRGIAADTAASAAAMQEAAKAQKEAAAALLEVMRSLGKEADNLRSRSRSSAASGD